MNSSKPATIHDSAKELLKIVQDATAPMKSQLTQTLKPGRRLAPWESPDSEYIAKVKLMLETYKSNEAILTKLQTTEKLTANELEFLKVYRDQFTQVGKEDNDLYNSIVAKVVIENAEAKSDEQYKSLTITLIEKLKTHTEKQTKKVFSP